MSNVSKIVDSFDLSGTESGKIEIAILEKPYGEESESVASIGIFLDKDSSSPYWKVHIPKSNIDKVIEALQKAKSELKS